MSGVLALLIAGVFTENVITSKLLGVEQIEDKITLKSLLQKCGVLSVLLFATTLVTYPVFRFILVPLGAEYLSAFCGVIIICGLIAATIVLAKRFLPSLHKFLNVNREVLTCSAVVLGLSLSFMQNELVTGYLSALVLSLSSCVGFTAVSVVFHGINDRLKESDLPECIKGLPITLTVAAFISLAFSGLA